MTIRKHQTGWRTVACTGGLVAIMGMTAGPALAQNDAKPSYGDTQKQQETQQRQQNERQRQSDQRQTNSRSEQTNRLADRSDASNRAHADDQHMMSSHRLSQMLGRNVENPQQQELGEIEDVVLDINNGQVAYVVLSFGGWLGIGDDLFAIPFESFKLTVNSDRPAQLDITKQKLEGAEGFDEDNWPDMADRQWATKVHTHYGQKPYWQRDPSDSPENRVRVERQDATERAAVTNGARDTRERTPSADVAKQDALWVHQASALIGYNVTDHNDETVGEISDIVVDGHGRITAVIIDHGGDYGETGDYAALPWRGLRVEHAKETITLKVDPSQLSAVSFKSDAESWPEFSNEDWTKKFDRFFPEMDSNRDERISTGSERRVNVEPTR